MKNLLKFIFFTYFFHVASSYACGGSLAKTDQYGLLRYFENASNFTSDIKNQVYYTANNTLFRDGVSLAKHRSLIANFYVSPGGENIYIATKEDGLFISKNGGLNFRGIWENDSKAMHELYGVYVNGKEELIVIAKDDENARIKISKDGEGWVEYPIPVKFTDIKAVHIDKNIKILIDGPKKGFLLISDDGSKWQRKPLPLKFDDIGAFHFGGHKIYLGTDNQKDGNFLMISADEGSSWQRPKSNRIFREIRSILSDVENNVYILDRDGFEKNVEDFNRWERSSGFPWKVLWQLFERNGNVYVITNEGILGITYGKTGPVYLLDIATRKKFLAKAIHVTLDGSICLGGAFVSEAEGMNNRKLSHDSNELKTDF